MNMEKLGPYITTRRKENPWDEFGRTKIAQIFVWHGEAINAIQFQYVENGNLVLSEIFGSRRTSKFHSIQLNYPAEHIISISGHYHLLDYIMDMVSSLTVVTNVKTLGPYGCPEDEDEEFHYEVGKGNFGGFYGICHSNGGLRFIGIYLRPALTLDELNLIERPAEMNNVENKSGHLNDVDKSDDTLRTVKSSYLPEVLKEENV